MENVILVMNAGSSNIKVKVFSENFDKIAEFKEDLELGFQMALEKLTKNFAYNIKAIGHRVVHGGREFRHPVLIDNKVIDKLKDLIELAPLHQPNSIKIIETISRLYPNLPQVACFDTAFHIDHDELVSTYPLPYKLKAEGIIKYGFHGLSYEYIVSRMPSFLKDKKVVIAHLGSGSSVCGVESGKSVASSMGFSALEGLMMATRSGAIDPGIILYLIKRYDMSHDQLEHLLYYESGLFGISGISSDFKKLQESEDQRAKFAIDLYCFKAAQEIMKLLPSLKGLDAVIFTAGIGENASHARQKISGYLSFLGAQVDAVANIEGRELISTENSKILLYSIPTNEELIIAKHTKEVIYEFAR